MLCFKGSQVELCKLRCISVLRDCSYLSKQCWWSFTVYQSICIQVSKSMVQPQDTTCYVIVVILFRFFQHSQISWPLTYLFKRSLFVFTFDGISRDSIGQWKDISYSRNWLFAYKKIDCSLSVLLS